MLIKETLLVEISADELKSLIENLVVILAYHVGHLELLIVIRVHCVFLFIISVLPSRKLGDLFFQALEP